MNFGVKWNEFHQSIANSFGTIGIDELSLIPYSCIKNTSFINIDGKEYLFISTRDKFDTVSNKKKHPATKNQFSMLVFLLRCYKVHCDLGYQTIRTIWYWECCHFDPVSVPARYPSKPWIWQSGYSYYVNPTNGRLLSNSLKIIWIGCHSFQA